MTQARGEALVCGAALWRALSALALLAGAARARHVACDTQTNSAAFTELTRCHFATFESDEIAGSPFVVRVEGSSSDSTNKSSRHSLTVRYAVSLGGAAVAHAEAFQTVAYQSAVILKWDELAASTPYEIADPNYADVIFTEASDSYLRALALTTPEELITAQAQDPFLNVSLDQNYLSLDVSNLWEGDSAIPGLARDRCSTADGQRMCVPFAGSAFVMVYSTTLLDSLGLKFPTDWDSLLRVCAAVKALNKLCIGVRAPRYGYKYMDGPWRVMDHILRRTLGPADLRALAEGTLPWTHPEVLLAAAKYEQLARLGYLGFHTDPQNDTNSRLYAEVLHFVPGGHTAMAPVSSSAAARAEVYNGDLNLVSYAAFPEVRTPDTRPTKSERLGVFGAFMKSTCANPANCAEAVDTMANMGGPLQQSGFAPFFPTAEPPSQLVSLVRSMFNESNYSNDFITPYSLYWTKWANTTTQLLQGALTADEYCRAMEVEREVNILKVAHMPSVTPPGGLYPSSIIISITTIQSDVTVYYTLDGTTPTEGSTAYSGPFALSTYGASTVRAIAVPQRTSQLKPSAVAVEAYEIKSTGLKVVYVLILPFALFVLVAAATLIIFAATGNYRTRRRVLRMTPAHDVTIVFCGVEASAELWSCLDWLMKGCVEQMLDCLRKRLRLHRGYEVKTQADAMMIAFHTAFDALTWCTEVQQDLMDVDWPQELLTSEYGKIVMDSNGKCCFRGLRVRMGVHKCSNAAREYDKSTKRVDYYGQDVNIAARMGGIAHGGQVLCTRECAGSLPEELPFPEAQLPETRRVGLATLKGIEGPQEVFEVQLLNLYRSFAVLQEEAVSTLVRDRSNAPHCTACLRPCKTCVPEPERSVQDTAAALTT